MSELRTIRKRLGLTQSEMGDRLGRSGPTMSLYEKGRRPTPKAVMIAARALE